MTITASMVNDLRKETGAGMMECKKALEEAKGNKEEALVILRKRGLAKVEKRSGKVAAEGRIAAAVSSDQKFGLIMEVNCETDFVARDQGFKAFVQELLEQGLAKKVKDIESLLALPSHSKPGVSLDQQRQELASKIGENIQVRRLSTLESNQLVGAYTHGDRIGVLVAIDKNEPTLAKDVAMHIAASNPVSIDKDQVPQDLIAREKEIYSAQARESGKPEAIIEKMVAGRLAKYYQEVCLLHQPFVKNPDETVEKLLASHKAKVLSFVRYAVGEGIEKEEVDFAAEVRAQVRGG